jgi:putative ABC transport system ATP-binding protein
MLRIENLVVRQGDRTLFHLSPLSLAAGQSGLVLGPSGSGKTTLLNTLAGLRTPEGGRVMVNDVDLYTLPDTARDTFRGQSIGLVFQRPHLIPSLNVRRNITLAAELAGVPLDTAFVDGMIARLGLAEHARALPHTLSTGQALRATLARALATKPRLVLADEPTSALDDANAATVATLLKEAAADTGATLVIATHDQRLKVFLPTLVTLGDAQ